MHYFPQRRLVFVILYLVVTSSALGEDASSTQPDLKGDLNSSVDAGATFATALSIVTLGRYEKNHLGGVDKVDIFSFDAKAGERYQVIAAPGATSHIALKLRILDQAAHELASSAGEIGEEVKISPIHIASSGTYFLEISDRYNAKEYQEYSLDVRKLSDSAAKTK